MKLFIDTNVVLDLLQYREPWVNDTIVLFQLAKEKKVELVVTDLTLVNVVYIAGKNFEKKKLYETLLDLKKLVSVVSIGNECIEQALNSYPFDFEDSTQYFAAKREKVDYILTRDINGFKMSDVPVMNVTDFLNNFL